MKRLAISTIVVLNLISTITLGQFFNPGQERYGQKWRQIRTSNFRLIYPASVEEQALQTASYLESIRDSVQLGLHHGTRRIPVVLHPNSILSNGFVSWAPKRMELVTTPAFDGYQGNWLNSVASHELRHVVQIDKLNNRFTRVLYFLFGEQVVGGVTAFVPTWFLEGDAVYAETEISDFGRGREPQFLQQYRAYFANSQTNFSYDKLLLGSYKHNIPNHYQFGYPIVAYGRKQYGDSLWSNMLRFTSGYPYTLIPSYFSIKAQTGLSRKGLAQSTFAYLHSTWSANKVKEPLPSKVLGKEKAYADFRYPQQLNDSTLFAYQTSIGKTPSFVFINTLSGDVKTIKRVGYIDSRVSICDGIVVWAEFDPHPRWEYLNYSNIRTLNIKTGEYNVVTRRGKFFSPVLLGRNLFAISYSTDGAAIVRVEPRSGNVLQSVSFEQGLEPRELVLTSENQLAVLAYSNSGAHILSLDAESMLLKPITPPLMRYIRSISYSNGRIFFSAASGTSEKIFSLDTENGALSLVLESNLGVTDPFFLSQNNQLLVSSFTTDGYKAALYPPASVAVSEIEAYADPFTITSRKPVVESAPLLSGSKRYSKAANLFRIHSWGPIYYDLDDIASGTITAYPGLSVLSQNLTGTVVASAGYSIESEGNALHSGISYSGMYPKITLTANKYDVNARTYSPFGIVPYNSNRDRFSLSASVLVPVTLSANAYLTGFSVRGKYTYSNDMLYKPDLNAFRHGLSIVENSLWFYSHTRMSHRDIRPQLGVTLHSQLVSSPFDDSNFGWLSASTVRAYIPGFARNHSLMLSYSYQKQGLERFYLANKIVFPRGYADFISQELNTLSANYLFPFWYPDINVGSLLYVKRFFANVYFDYGVNSFPARREGQLVMLKSTMHSYGAEVYADFNLFRTRYPLRIGYRQGFMGEDFEPFNEVLFSVDINQLFGFGGVKELLVEPQIAKSKPHAVEW